MTRLAIWMLSAALLAGCHTMGSHHAHAPPVIPPDMPRELSKVILPTYTIEPPDILVVEAIHVVPRSPYVLRTGDIIAINVIGTLPDAPVAGAFPIQPGGIINLGPPYGTVKLTGATIDQAL